MNTRTSRTSSSTRFFGYAPPSKTCGTSGSRRRSSTDLPKRSTYWGTSSRRSPVPRPSTETGRRARATAGPEAVERSARGPRRTRPGSPYLDSVRDLADREVNSSRHVSTSIDHDPPALWRPGDRQDGATERGVPGVVAGGRGWSSLLAGGGPAGGTVHAATR